MNNKKYTIFICTAICILSAGVYGMYRLHTYVSNYSARVIEINTKLKTLEEARGKASLYKKILSKGSKEQAQIDAYILSGDAVFQAITDLEKDGKKSGMFNGEDGGIASVRKRDNENLSTLGAGEVVVEVVAQGTRDAVDAYIHGLLNLPYVSHIEDVSLQFMDKTKTKAHITLVITEIL